MAGEPGFLLMASAPDQKTPSAFDPYATSYIATVDQALAGTGVKASYFSRYRARYLCSSLELAGTSKILDYGCGTGNLSAQLLTALPELRIDGYDPSSQSIGAVPQSLQDQGIFSSDLKDLGGGYDVIVMAMVMHHVVPAQRVGVLQKIRGMMASNGRLVIFEHNPVNPLTRRIVDRCPFDADAVLLGPAEAADLVQAAGLQHVRRDYLGFFPPILGRLDRFLRACPWGVQYVLVSARAPRS
jgi:SAM-dependent methyltransferase